MIEIKAADLEVRCFFTWRIKGHIRSYGSGGMETGDWGLGTREWGLRVDGPLGRRFLRGLSLTRLRREGCGGASKFIEGALL